MAYAITLNNNLLRIAANETEKNELTAINTPHTEIDISDSDFNIIKQNSATWTIDGNSMTISEQSEPGSIANAEDLHLYLKDIRDALTRFIVNANANTQAKTLYTQVVNYNNYLDTFDTSTVSYPIVTWEKYCADNGITYLNLLQLP
jgi:hypothetical protein